MASTSRILPRNWLPNPSPLLAPRPPISAEAPPGRSGHFGACREQPAEDKTKKPRTPACARPPLVHPIGLEPTTSRSAIWQNHVVARAFSCAPPLVDGPPRGGV